MKKSALMVTLILLLFSSHSQAKQRIAVLDFELIDITSLPNTAQERQRTASIRPLLEQTLSKIADYELINIDSKTITTANASIGYLFSFDDLAAKLGEQFNADWVIVGRHSKPSFLFSYLMVHIIQVKNKIAIANIDIELKGNHEKVTERGVKTLTNKIQQIIR